jgi:peptidoglycan hydrolase-like protein with peptidoglycan-binding domain
MDLQSRNLSIQTQGEDVKLLHITLRQLGYSIQADEIDTQFFGPATREAVLDVQQRNRLEATGRVDDLTAKAIKGAVDALSAQTGRFIVQGQVSKQDGSPAAQIIVKAVDKDLRHEQALGETTTNQDGRYEITYTAKQFRRAEKKAADLAVHFFNVDGKQLGTSEILFNAPAVATFHMIVALPAEKQRSEYERLVEYLLPLLEDVHFSDLTDEDIAFLVAETGDDRQRLEFLRQGAKLSLETHVPTTVFYGLARQGLSLAKESLLALDPDTWRRALTTASAQHIIPAMTQASLDEISKLLTQLRLITHKLIGQLLNQEKVVPLAGLKVHGFDLDAGAEPQDLGSSVTDSQGLFTLVYKTQSERGEKTDSGRRFQLQIILNAQTNERYQTDIQVTMDQEQVVAVSVPMPAAPQTSHPLLTELATALHLEIPQALLTALSAQNIHTLADIRAAGGFSRLPGLSRGADDPLVQTLEAHADLSRLSPDIHLNASLIAHGYTSVATIAAAPRSAFVSLAQEQLGDFKAARLHTVAVAQTHTLNNMLMGIGADAANGFSSSLDERIIEDLYPTQCGCTDCEAAVSPLAYLADLLDYALKHLSQNQQPVPLAFLISLLHQPFDKLPASCKAMDTQVCQVRICIEVLRACLAPVTGSAALDEAEQAYRLAAYLTPLNQVGTSFEELRLLRRDTSLKRKALADRLGIAPGSTSPDHLDELLLDPTTITEQKLETLFGLVDTTRDPLLDNLVPPLLQTWRLDYLRALWQEQDRPTNPYSAGTLPVIDPDLIGPADLRRPLPGDSPYDLWQTRSDWVKTELDALKLLRQTQGITKAIEHALPGPLPDLTRLYQNLGQGIDIPTTRSTITRTLLLTIESFTRLMSLKARSVDPDPLRQPTAAGWEEFDAILVQAEKVQRFAQWWSEEQSMPGGPIALGPEHFWIALSEPKLPAWRATSQARQSWQQALLARSQDPIIDPDVIGLGDLRDQVTGVALQLWQRRNTWLTAQHSQFVTVKLNAEAVPGATTLDVLNAVLTPVFDMQSAGLLAIAAEGKQGQPIEARIAQLTLSGKTFAYLLRLCTLATDAASLLDSEWDNIYAILRQTQKCRAFAQWRDEEQEAQLLLDSTFFTPIDPSLEILPQTLPLITWREQQDARGNWQDTLQARLEQEATVITGLQGAVTSTEEATLAPLRDALILATDALGTNVHTRARWVTRRFCIDASSSTCQKTTRIEQAIETVQGLLFSVQTGQFIAAFAHPASEPAAISWGNKRIDVFMQGTDKALWHQWVANGRWENGERLDGPLDDIITSAPAAASEAEGQLSLFVRGSDNALWFRRFAGGIWQPWESLAEPPGVVVTSAPAAASWGAGRLDVFVQGSDNNLWHRCFDGGAWQGWESLGVNVTFGPAVVSWGVGRLDVFVRRMDRALWHTSFEGGAWQSWESLGAPFGVLFGSLPSDVNPAATAWSVGRLDVFVRGVNHALWSKTFVSGAWQAWKSLGGSLTFGPAAASWGEGHLDVFARGTDSALWHKEFAGGSWQNWESLSAPLTLSADNFAEEWKWIGSYATWRAAMFVFLYPENILLPTLRRWQTPGFQALVADVRQRGRVQPADEACSIAQTYAQYFQDVCSLTIEATCQVLTTRGRADACGLQDTPNTWDLTYFFARTTSGKIYWSTAEPGIDAGYGQSFWQLLANTQTDSVQLVKIIGAMPYRLYTGKRYIYLFVWTHQGYGKQSLGYYRFDVDQFSGENGVLHNDGWDLSLHSLALPPLLPQKEGTFTYPDPYTCTAVQSLSENAPALAIVVERYNDTNKLEQHLYVRRLDKNGEDWEWRADTDTLKGASWDFWKTPTVIADGNALQGIVDLGNETLLMCMTFLDNVSLWSYYANYAGGYDGNAPPEPLTFVAILPDSAGSSFVGIIPRVTSEALENTSVYFLYQNNGTVTYQLYDTMDRLVSVHPDTLTTSIDRIVPTSGYIPIMQEDTRQFGCHQADGWYRSVFLSGPTVNSLADEGVAALPRAVPGIGNPCAIPGRLTGEERQLHRQLISQMFLANPYTPSSMLTYLQEAYYFVPLFLAMQLQQQKQYDAALEWCCTIYDYNAQAGQRVIYTPLEHQSFAINYQRAYDWLLDPLNPHAIAETRPFTYLRFTLMAIVRCLLDCADDEFTTDTSESLAQARTYYMIAQDLLDTDILQQRPGTCEDVIGTIDISLGKAQGKQMMDLLKGKLRTISDLTRLKSLVTQVKEVLESKTSRENQLTRALSLIEAAHIATAPPPVVGTVISNKGVLQARACTLLLTRPTVQQAVEKAGTLASEDLTRSMTALTGLSASALTQDKQVFPWLRQESAFVEQNLGTSSPSTTTEIRRSALELASTNGSTMLAPVGKWLQAGMIGATRTMPATFIPAPMFSFCIPPNPILQALRTHVEAQLFKLHSCRNIAGMVRQRDPYGAPTDTQSGLPTIGSGGQLSLPATVKIYPTQYRYTVLIDRAKQLVQLAAQIESSMLNAFERSAAAAYTLLQARQDLEVAQAQVQLHNLLITEAQRGVDLAGMQKARAQKQADTYQAWLDAGMNEWETAMIADYQQAAQAQEDAAGYAAMAQLLQAFTSAAAGGVTGAPAAMAFASGLLPITSAQASATQTGLAKQADAQVSAVYASYEERSREWGLQQSLATFDVQIGDEQQQMANDHVDVVKQEQAVAKLQADHKKTIVDFLVNQFTGVELYDWMSAVLESVYSFFLQQATAIANLAQNQLAFERQEVPPQYIQADYWQASSQNQPSVNTQSPSADRHGLTGSARLLQDIYQLDQYAFESNKRKMQLTKTISLAQLDPYVFQRFRETGVLSFVTPTELFDRDFPGHYLRLIKRVRTSLIALIPPVQGIHATLATGGISRVVIGGEVYQTVVVRRDPEIVALSSPLNATGVFELDTQSELLLPFEGIGVDTSWEFRMPRAANHFDYSTIADALVTFEYTALQSFDYYQQVIHALKPTLSANNPFSFRTQFADQWYDLHNPDQAIPPPMVVRFTTGREDFPPNLDDLRIEQVLLYVVGAAQGEFEVNNLQLHFTAQGSRGPVGGEASTLSGMVNTRSGSAGSWLSMIGRPPFGEWELDVSSDPDILNHLKNEDIQDILLVITYIARTPQWPA